VRRIAAASVKRVLGVLLNLVLLLSAIPTLMFALLDLQAVGRITSSIADFGLGTIYMSLFALALWHLVIWEHRIEIRRREILMLVRAIKSAWVGYMPFLLALPQLPPPKVAIPFVIGGVTYALVRHLFAPRYRI
jgi:hypothetical protein